MNFKCPCTYLCTASKPTLLMGGTRILLIQIRKRNILFEKTFQLHSPKRLMMTAYTAGASTNEWDTDGWPKGPYTQQIEGVLPALLTDDIVTTHLKSSGKQIHPKKPRKVSRNDDGNLNITSYSNIDYSTLQRGHQYFMESYIPGGYVRF